MNSSPVVTDSDRARGWAELEVEFLDGSQQCVRIHPLTKPQLIRLARFDPAEAMAEGVAKSLRVDKDFVSRMQPEYLCAALAMMALLSSGDVTGKAIVSRAVHLAQINMVKRN